MRIGYAFARHSNVQDELRYNVLTQEYQTLNADLTFYSNLVELANNAIIKGDPEARIEFLRRMEEEFGEDD